MKLLEQCKIIVGRQGIIFAHEKSDGGEESDFKSVNKCFDLKRLLRVGRIVTNSFFVNIYEDIVSKKSTGKILSDGAKIMKKKKKKKKRYHGQIVTFKKMLLSTMS